VQRKIKDTYINTEDGSSRFSRKFSIPLTDDATTQMIIT
jgi:hypothetical protein